MSLFGKKMRPAPIPENNLPPNYYPIDLDAGLKFTRPRKGFSIFGTPCNANNLQQLGYLNGMFSQQDLFVWMQAIGKMPFGPVTSAPPVNLTSQITIPGLNKQAPQY